MANRADNARWLKDGNLDFSGGVDSSRNPSQIDRDQISSGVNCNCRGGTISPRLGLLKKTLDFTGSPNIETPFKTPSGPFQHGSFYDGNGTPALISSHAGRIFKVDIATLKVRDITPLKNLTTQTTAAVTIPAVNGTVAVAVVSTDHMFSELTNIDIGGYSFVLVSIDTPTQITVKNLLASQVAVVIASPATLTFNTYDVNSPVLTKGWSEQAENYWIYQDNQSYPIIFDGSGSVRSNPALSQIPVGNVMCYTAGRLSVALPDRQSFRVGDIVFGSSGTAINNYRDSMLYFTENNYLNEGGDFVARVFGAPSNSGPILAMKACAMTDAQLGQGPMIVGTPNMVFTVNLPYDRTTWKNLANAIQTANPVIGPQGQDSTVLVNTDLWYRSLDGIRSWIMAQRQFNSWGNTPMSQELGDTLSHDTKFLLENGSAVLFDNRLLYTISPVQSAVGVWHRGLVSMDFNLVSTIRKKTAPCWEGIWTGLRILQIVRGLVNQEERCFLYVLNGQEEIEIWEVVPASKVDEGKTRIEWSIETPSYNCGNSDEFKRLETGRIIFAGLSGTLDVVVKYRTDLSPCWVTWCSFQLCAKNEDCGPHDCVGPHTYREQERTPIRLPMPPDDFDSISNRKNRTGFEFQLRLELTGYAQIRQLRIYTLNEPESINAERTVI